MLTVCGGIIMVIGLYTMLMPQSERFIPELAFIAVFGALCILLDILNDKKRSQY